MTWKEINKKYEKESKSFSLIRNDKPELGSNWKNIMDSTDKLIWLFMISNEFHKKAPIKVLNEDSRT